MLENSASLKSLWTNIVNRYFDKNAIFYDNTFFSYSYLDIKASYIANYISQNHDSEYIGVMFDNSIEYICSIIGILKAGKCFVPIDLQWPEERKKIIISNCTLKIIITSKDNESVFNEAISIDDIYRIGKQTTASEWKEGKSAYILHSSGTTGNPKGIEISVRSLENLIQWFGKEFLSEDIKNILQLARISFDVSIEEIFGTLFNGRTLYIPPVTVRYHKNKLRKYISSFDINLIEVVPITLKEYFKNENRIECLKIIICGADVLHEGLKNSILKKGYQLYNNYGPTETTVDAMFYKCSLDEPVQLGKCVSGGDYFIINEQNEVIEGCGIGEICFTGVNIAIGYFNNSLLNSEKFIHINSKRYYKTGDLVKRDEFGRIFYIGRTDNQIKIRGQRIELEEIEKVVIDYSKVDLCSAIYQKKFERIVLFYESQNDYSYQYFFGLLKEKLPYYMIPSDFIKMEKIPVTNNGKINRKKLSEIEISKEYKSVIEYDDITKEIVQLMANTLKLNYESINIEETFEQIGFDSLSYVEFLVYVEDRWGVEMDESFLIRSDVQPAVETIEEIKKIIEGR